MMVSTLEIPVRPAYTTKWLFHRPEFLHSGNNNIIRTFYQYSENEVLAMLRCTIDQAKAVTAINGFYGCMELTDQADIGKLLTYVQSELLREGCAQLSVSLFPEEYNPTAWKKLRAALENNDFVQNGNALQSMIPVSFEENEQLANNDWRSTANNITEYSITQEPLENYQKISQLIHRNKTVSGTNGEDSLLEYCLSHLPENVVIFAVRDGVKYSGLGVFLKAGPGLLYTLHLSQMAEYSQNKPLLALFQFVYEWAELNDINYVDLGQISMDFQENIGTVQVSSERWVRSW